MENKIKKIGLVIADTDEYKPFLDYALKNGGRQENFYNRSGCTAYFTNGKNSISVYAICCGIGKVNAAAAAMHLAESGADLIVSLGLSGGISGVYRGQVVLGSRFLEHDFDLTGIGYDFAEKPAQEYIYCADEKLTEIFCKELNCKSGTMVCGDKFVSDEALRDLLKSRFNAVACDMETAAVAYIGHLTNIPFVAIRIVSDDAGSDAYTDYSRMNTFSTDTLTEKFVLCVNKLLAD